MRNLFLSIFSFIVFSSLNPLIANAQLYKWVDENGKTHFSDQPPRKQKAEKLNMPVSKKSTSRNVPTDAERRIRQQQLLKTMAADRKKREDERAAEKLAKQTKAERCKHLLERKNKFIRANHIYTTDEKGERQYYDEETADKRRRAAVEQYEKECAK